jgi:hypothetical protein
MSQMCDFLLMFLFMVNCCKLFILLIVRTVLIVIFQIKPNYLKKKNLNSFGTIKIYNSKMMRYVWHFIVLHCLYVLNTYTNILSSALKLLSAHDLSFRSTCLNGWINYFQMFKTTTQHLQVAERIFFWTCALDYNQYFFMYVNLS